MICSCCRWSWAARARSSLLDPPLWPPAARRARFFTGFALITVAFPFGRNVALATFSKVLGPCDQGEWMGLMFVVGAVAAVSGPSRGRSTRSSSRASCSRIRRRARRGGGHVWNSASRPSSSARRSWTVGRTRGGACGPGRRGRRASGETRVGWV